MRMGNNRILEAMELFSRSIERGVKGSLNYRYKGEARKWFL